ncbi:Vitamin B12 transporter BtuB [subsurface metagenome]
MRYRLTILLCLNILYSLSQENAVIKGKITDLSNNRALTGASIFSDSSKGVISDIDGNYLIHVIPGASTLTFQYIGYKPVIKTIHLQVGDTLTLHAELETERTMLDEIIVTAGRYEQKISEVIVSTEILKPEMIENTNTTSLDQIINQVPGIDMMDGQARIRGGSGFSFGAGSRVLVLVDDLSILAADASDVKWEYMPIENISQVEIIKGASSVLYGSSALNGVINVRTAYPGNDPVTKINLFNGVYMNPRRKELVWWGSQPLFAGASFFHSRKAGNLDIVTGSHVFSDAGYRENEWEQRARLNFSLRYRNKKIAGLSYGVNTNMMYHEKIDFFLWQDANSGAYKQNPDAIPWMIGTRVNIDPYISYYHKTGSNHSLRTRFFRVNNNYQEDPDKNTNAILYHAEYKYHKPFTESIKGTFGISETYSVVRSELYGNHSSLNTALYGQFDAKILKRLNFSLGIRWETMVLDEESEKSKPVFRTGMNYQLTPVTFLRASFGQGYRFPSIAEKYTATSVSAVNVFPNPELKSEKGWSAEFGIKQGLKLSQWKGFIDFTVFWTEYSDMIEYVFDVYAPDSVEYPTFDHFGFKSLNVDNTRINGIDITLSGTGKIFGIPMYSLLNKFFVISAIFACLVS